MVLLYVWLALFGVLVVGHLVFWRRFRRLQPELPSGAGTPTFWRQLDPRQPPNARRDLHAAVRQARQADATLAWAHRFLLILNLAYILSFAAVLAAFLLT